MAFEFYNLPYEYDALEPHIDAQTMEIHYSRHHRTYYDKMIAALQGTEAAAMKIERVLAQVKQLGTGVQNNAGGYYNHNLYWECMSPSPVMPQGSLQAEIEKSFNTLDDMKTALADACIARFGSGFAWLIVTPKRTLKIVSTANQDNPLMDVVDQSVRGIPIFGIDVWEHAYYLRYQNKRPDYVKAFWNVACFAKAQKLYDKAMDETKAE